MGYSGAGGKLIHEKKSRDTVPLKSYGNFLFFIFVDRKPNYESMLEQISMEQNFRVIYVCSEVGPHSVQCLDRDQEIRIRYGAVQFLVQDPLFPGVRTYL
jgi:hypothetical protein